MMLVESFQPQPVAKAAISLTHQTCQKSTKHHKHQPTNTARKYPNGKMQPQQSRFNRMKLKRPTCLQMRQISASVTWWPRWKLETRVQDPTVKTVWECIKALELESWKYIRRSPQIQIKLSPQQQVHQHPRIIIMNSRRSKRPSEEARGY